MNTQPVTQTPEQLEELNISQLSQIVTQDTLAVQQMFQKFQSQATMFSFLGMPAAVDPRIWHVNHLFQFKHFLEGYNNMEAFFLSKGLTRFSQYLNAIKADINKALNIYGAGGQQSSSPQQQQAPQGQQVSSGGGNYMDQIMKIQNDANDYATKTILDTNKNWQDTFDKTNKMWDGYLNS